MIIAKNCNFTNNDLTYTYSVLVTDSSGTPVNVDANTVPSIKMFVNGNPIPTISSSALKRGSNTGSYYVTINNINTYQGTQFTFIVTCTVSATVLGSQETVQRIDNHKLDWIYNRLTQKSEGEV